MRVYKNYTKKIACNYLIDSSVKGCFIVYCSEARYYRAPTFTSRDPLFEKYFWMSPYAYCANNPVKYVDPTGMSFDPVIDEDNKTITIRATYHTSKENAKDLQKALNLWNEQSGKFSYETGKGKNKQTYTINFDLTIQSYDTQEEAQYNYEQNAHKLETNIYKGKTLIGGEYRETRGNASVNTIAINPETVTDITRTLAHEVGHTLGIGHYDGGLMQSGGTAKNIPIEYIQEMVSRFTTGPTTYSTWQSCPKSDSQRSVHETSWKNWFDKKPMSGKIK